MKKNKKAFTLAEVIITLGLIGVVSAMSIPTLISSFKAREVETKLKEVYSTLQYAVAAYDGAYTKTYTTNSFYNTFIKNRVHSLTPCTSGTDCFVDVKTLNGGSFSPRGKTFIMPDGSHILFGTSGSNFYKNHGIKINGVEDNATIQLVIYTDVNGSKFPNTIGKDIYIMGWNGKKLVPAGYDIPYEELKKHCTSEDSAGSGIFCMQKVISDGWKVDSKLLK